MISRISIRGVVLLTGVLVVLASCGGSARTLSRAPAWADDVARAYGTSTDDAIRIVRRASAETHLPEQQVARAAVNQAGRVANIRTTFLGYVDDLQRYLRQQDEFWEQVIWGAFCDTLVGVSRGQAATIEGVSQSVAQNFGEEAANALLQTDWPSYVVDLVEALESGEDIDLFITEAVYCS